jgi:hypothetical protein
MGFTGDLMGGLAALLAARGVGTYNPSGAYTAAQTGIVHDVVPSSPDRVIVLTPYSPTDDPTLSDSVVRVQVRVRGTRDPRTAYDLDDAAFQVLHNLPRQTIGGAVVTGGWRRSGAYIGPDSNGRHERTSNYEFQVHRPTEHRT